MSDRPRLVAPARRKYPSHVCGALKDPKKPSELCGKAARFYPSGWRCDVHAPGKTRPTQEEQ